MTDPFVGTNEHPTHAQPRSLRVIGWLSVVAGAWSIGDEVIRLLRGPGVRWIRVSLGVVTLAGGIGLLRSRRWGDLVSVALLIYSMIWGAWFFFIQGDFTLSARLTGIPVVLFNAILVAFMLAPSSRRWFNSVER